MVSISSLPKIKQGIVERLTVLQQDLSGNPPRQVIFIERLELSTLGSRLRFKGTGRLKQEEFVVSGWADQENAPVAYPFRLDLGIARQKATLNGKLIPASALQSGFALEAGVEVEGEQLGPLLAALGLLLGAAVGLATLVNPLLGVLPLVEPGFADAGKCAAFSQELRAINSRAKALTTR